jgi:hypothetical protein
MVGRRAPQAQSNLETIAAEVAQQVHVNNATRPANFMNMAYACVNRCTEQPLGAAAHAFVDKQIMAPKPPEFVELWLTVCDAQFNRPSTMEAVAFANCVAEYGESPVSYATRLQHCYNLAGNLGNVDLQNMYMINLDHILPGLGYETMQLLVSANISPPFSLGQMRDAAQRQYVCKASVASGNPTFLAHAHNQSQKKSAKQTAALSVTDRMAAIQPAQALTAYQQVGLNHAPNAPQASMVVSSAPFPAAEGPSMQYTCSTTCQP